jgi:hypothetical protein
MQPFTFIGFVDTWALSSSLRSKLYLFDSAGIFLAREGNAWSPVVRLNWKALWNAVARIMKHPLASEMEFGSVWIEELKPHSQAPWGAAEPAAEWAEGQVALVTNPSAHIFCGLTAQHLPIGHYCVVNRAFPRCSVNWGDTPRFHLFIETRRKPDGDR